VNELGSETVPGPVHGIVIDHAQLFFGFGLNQWLQYRRAGRWQSYANGKRTYLVRICHSEQRQHQQPHQLSRILRTVGFRTARSDQVILINSIKAAPLSAENGLITVTMVTIGIDWPFVYISSLTLRVRI
jgi:Heliorhodopsin